MPPKDSAKGVEISSSPVALSLARGCSLSFPSSGGPLQGMPSPRQNTPQPLDFERRVPFNYERQHDAPSEKRSESPSSHSKESSRESSLAPHALEHGYTPSGSTGAGTSTTTASPYRAPPPPQADLVATVPINSQMRRTFPSIWADDD